MKTWSELSDIEKGALLLAHHEGKTIEYTLPWRKDWETCCEEPCWSPNVTYRVRPVVDLRSIPYKDYTITFKLIDGVPDCNSIWMEKV